MLYYPSKVPTHIPNSTRQQAALSQPSGALIFYKEASERLLLVEIAFSFTGRLTAAKRLKFVSRSWFNLDATWAFSLVLVG
jgi:hypothetical protein